MRGVSGRRGSASVEFALIAAVVIAMLLAVTDLTNAITTGRRLTIAAQSIAEIATGLAAQPDGTNALATTQVWTASTATFALFPIWKNPSRAKSYAVTLSAVAMTATVNGCVSACTYTAKTAWSVAFSPGAKNTRPCGTLLQVANTASETMATLPAGIFGPAPLLVADVQTIWTPSFVHFITGPIIMRRTAYLPARIVTSSQYVHLTPAGSPGTCPGY